MEYFGVVFRHNRKYRSKKELLKRFRYYKRNLRLAKMIQKKELGTAVYGETPFSDMTREEFRKVIFSFNFSFFFVLKFEICKTLVTNL